MTVDVFSVARGDPLSLRDAYRGVGGRAAHGAVAERVRERGYK
jgi:hypothetical protein